jgi:hypothetical protein
MSVQWIEQLLENKNNQVLLEEKVTLLLEGVLKGKSEYQKEKAVKSFSEGIRYLESLLQYKHGIHRSQIDLLEYQQNPKAFTEKYSEIERVIKMEINRQYRHFTTFLP